jgi:hypothetical protein
MYKKFYLTIAQRDLIARTLVESANRAEAVKEKCDSPEVLELVEKSIQDLKHMATLFMVDADERKLSNG